MKISINSLIRIYFLLLLLRISYRQSCRMEQRRKTWPRRIAVGWPASYFLSTCPIQSAFHPAILSPNAYKRQNINPVVSFHPFSCFLIGSNPFKLNEYRIFFAECQPIQQKRTDNLIIKLHVTFNRHMASAS